MKTPASDSTELGKDAMKRLSARLKILRKPMTLIILCVISVMSHAVAPQEEQMDRSGDLAYRPIFRVDLAGISVANNLFGRDRQRRGEHATSWYESVVNFGGAGFWDLDHSAVWAEVSVLGISSGGYDASISNPDSKYVNRLELHEAVVGWQSGNMFDMGYNAVNLAIGRQNYRVGRSFLIAKGGSDGGKRGALWIGPHSSWYNSATADIDFNKNASLNVFYLSRDDLPYSNTHLAGINTDLKFGDNWLFGAIIVDVFASDDKDRRNTFDASVRATYNADNNPGWGMDTQYVWQHRGALNLQKNAWFTEGSWNFGGPFTPRLSYRYASFDNDYDPLFYSSTTWGTWYQGEYLGQYILTNTNLASHQAKLVVAPAKEWTLSVLYYYFLANTANGGQFTDSFEPVTDPAFVQEYNLIADWRPTDTMKLSFVGAITAPMQGATQWTGGSKTVEYFLLIFSYDF
ncbi:Uncharacterised protein [BD1-7 clade bacterium]|uniref:Alginate export domain-containing protein n=1 Tax=BD1-7 clade bacterium TaxID=2029982 RepID=A0A5S9P2D5_9GAMM|nr:Uncharacterised protein [BD1-7 clade bacterium]CAA0116452.1 Uncharacterised protein [BD1-7 clade bacterium]